MLIDIIVVSFNSAELIVPMINSVHASTEFGAYRFLVVDNASSDDSKSIIQRELIDCFFISNQTNVGFGRANNQLVPHIEGDFVLLLNTDAFVSPDTLEKTVAFMEENPDCGVLGVKLVGSDGKLQPCCRYFPTPLNVFLNKTGIGRFFPGVRLVDDMGWEHDAVRECDWVPGCYYLIRREVLETVGLFDPRFFLYCEEVDHCRRVKQAGWKVIFYPHTQVVHLGGESAKTLGNLSNMGRQLSSLQVESELLYFRKYYGIFGIISHICLQIVGDLYISAKHMIRRQWRSLVLTWRNQKLFWGLLVKTRFASKPTR